MPRDGKYAPMAWVRPAAIVALCRANSFSSSVARPAGFQNAASPRPSAPTAVCPMPTAWAPIGKTRNSAPALRGSSWAESWTVGKMESASKTGMETASPIPTVPHSNLPSEGLRLIDQHDRDVVLDRVDQPAGVTGKLLDGSGAVLERPLALWADEDLEEIGREAHDVTYPRRLSEGSWRRHLGSTLTCRSRNTRWSRRPSILVRAAASTALIVRPPCPSTMRFWLSRST